jgi:hypothetical protein
MKPPKNFPLAVIGSCSILSLLILLSICAFLGSCATIVSHTKWPIAIESKPEGVHVSIRNKSGFEIFAGHTPVVTQLRSGGGFFGKESYIVTLTHKSGEQRKINVECRINGWYFGNIIFGGLIGMLIVDPATGAMYRLENKDIYEVFKEDKTSQLKILDLNSIPDEWKACLVEL